MKDFPKSPIINEDTNISELFYKKTKKTNLFSLIKEKLLTLLYEQGNGWLFFIRSMKSLFQRPYRLNEILQNIEFIGNKSLLVIFLTSTFTGMVLSYQVYSGFVRVGTTSLVGPLVAISIFRELAPVMTGVVISARAGGAIAAQIASMRTSEQIDSLEVMGVNPQQYLVTPRIIAAMITTPILCCVFDFTALVGAYAFSTFSLNLDGAVFWDKIQTWIDANDILEGLIKASAFGVVFSTICAHSGFYASQGAKGVGKATNKGIVKSITTIIILDFFITRLLKFMHSN